MAKNKSIEVFGLSFMDLISCALGGMLVLMFVFSTLVNAKGVSKPSEAESRGMSPAALQRAEIFNTHFVLELKLLAETKVIINDWDIISFYGIEKEGNMENHLIVVVCEDKIVKEVSFQLENHLKEGKGKLMGIDTFVIPVDQSIITVVKNKTEYKIRNF